MTDIQRLKKDYPWIQTPLIVGAPMRLIALADMAVEISKAGMYSPTMSSLSHATPPQHLPTLRTGGIGFIGAGTDVSDLQTHLEKAKDLLPSTSLPSHPLPIGVGFINWGASLPDAIPLIRQYVPAAVWFFAPSSISSLSEWVQETRNASPETKIWVQIGSVAEARNVLEAAPDIDVLVVQGTDAGGHGLATGAGLISLLPEIADALATLDKKPVVIAAGGIADARGAAAALVLGASGTCMGTRFLAAHEANITKGYMNEVLRASDGGQTTRRTKVYDTLRGTNWAQSHNARGIVNQSYFDAEKGMSEEENKKLYEQEMQKGDDGWGEKARMTAYAGSVVGLVKEVKGAGEIVKEVREGTRRLLGDAKALL
jgi:nitronate monooxygenase